MSGSNCHQRTSPYELKLPQCPEAPCPSNEMTTQPDTEQKAYHDHYSVVQVRYLSPPPPFDRPGGGCPREVGVPDQHGKHVDGCLEEPSTRGQEPEPAPQGHGPLRARLPSPEIWEGTEDQRSHLLGVIWVLECRLLRC